MKEAGHLQKQKRETNVVLEITNSVNLVEDKVVKIFQK
jgi:hypothetical protein